MANIGQTMFRFAGALLLGAAATRYDRAPRGTPTVPVVVAAADISEGRIIDATALTVAMWPASAVPPGAYASLDSVVGRVARINVFKGEAIIPGSLARALARPGVEVRLTPGKRAYSVRLNDETVMPGLVRPNSRVDVLVLLADSTSRDGRKAFIVLDDVRVLAIGRRLGRSSDGASSRSMVATIEVSPEDVDLLAPAAAQGELQLVLRGSEDTAPVMTARIGAESRRLMR